MGREQTDRQTKWSWEYANLTKEVTVSLEVNARGIMKMNCVKIKVAA